MPEMSPQSELVLRGIIAIFIGYSLFLMSSLVILAGFLYCQYRAISWRRSWVFSYLVLSLIAFLASACLLAVMHLREKIAQGLGVARSVFEGELDFSSIWLLGILLGVLLLRVIYDLFRVFKPSGARPSGGRK